MRSRVGVVALLWLCSACDPAGGGERGYGSGPAPKPPRLSPIELKPPRIERSPTSRFLVQDPPAVDASQIDRFTQAEGRVDILWVIDDSGSMRNQRATLVSNFDRFLEALLSLKVDFQMGVTSTNARDAGRLRGAIPIISNQTPNPRQVFQENTTFLQSRTRWEQGLRMAELAISAAATTPTGPNAGFLRERAALAIIIVSDEDDSSLGDPAYYARVLRSAKTKGDENLVTVSAITGTAPNGCYPPGEEIYFGGLAEPAPRYAAVVQRTLGVLGSICDASFERTLLDIAQALNTLRRVFPLSLDPVPGSLSVRVNGVRVAEDAVGGWQYQASTRSVTFTGSFVPPPGAEVRLEYAYRK